MTMKKKVCSVLLALMLVIFSAVPSGAGETNNLTLEEAFSCQEPPPVVEEFTPAEPSEEVEEIFPEPEPEPEFEPEQDTSPFMFFTDGEEENISGETETDQELAEEIQDGRILAIAPMGEAISGEGEPLLRSGSSPLSPGEYRIYSDGIIYCDEVWDQESVDAGAVDPTHYRYVEYLDSGGNVQRSPLYCLNAQKTGIFPGEEGMTLKDAATRFMTNSNLKKMLYFGYGGPGDICSKYDPTCEHVDWSKTGNRYFYTHMALSIEYSGEYNGATRDEVKHIGLTAFMDRLKSLTIPSRSAVKLRGKDATGNNVTSDTLRTPMTLFMSRPEEGYGWLEKPFQDGFQRTGVLTVQDEAGAGNGITVTRPPGSEYQLIYWNSQEEYKTLGMENPHVLKKSGQAKLYTGGRFCLIFPKTWDKTENLVFPMLLYPAKYLFVDGNTQMGTPGGNIQDFGAYVYSGDPGSLTLTVLPAPFGKIRLVKTSSRTGEHLSGAVYELFAAEDLKSGNELQVRAGEKVAEGTTDERGWIVFANLIPGRYELREKTPPPGYLPNPEPVSAQVTEDLLQKVPVTDTPDIRGSISVEKVEAGTENHLPEAEFAVYAWSEKEGRYGALLETLRYDADSERYVSGTLTCTDDNKGRFRVLETKNPPGYTGAWQQDVELTEPGTEKTFTFRAENTPVTVKKVEIRKVDARDRSLLEGAEFTIYPYDSTLGTYEKDGTLLEYDGRTQTYRSEELLITEKNTGRFLVRETGSPPGYQGEWEQEINITDEKQVLFFTVENTPEETPEGQAEIIKTDSLTGEFLEGAVFRVYQWNRVSGSYEDTLGEKGAVSCSPREKKYRTALLEITEENEGKFKAVEITPPPGYSGTWEQEFVLSEDIPLVALTAQNDPQRLPVGSITVIKKIPEGDILWAHGNPVFLFAVEGRDQRGTFRKYEKALRFSPEGYQVDESGMATLEITFPNIPLGTYEVYEKPVLRFYLREVLANTENASVTKGQASGYGSNPREVAWGNAVLSLEHKDASFTFINAGGRYDGYSHKDVVENTISWGVTAP